MTNSQTATTGTHWRCPRLWGEVSWMRWPFLLMHGGAPNRKKIFRLGASALCSYVRRESWAINISSTIENKKFSDSTTFKEVCWTIAWFLRWENAVNAYTIAMQHCSAKSPWMQPATLCIAVLWRESSLFPRIPLRTPPWNEQVFRFSLHATLKSTTFPLGELGGQIDTTR